MSGSSPMQHRNPEKFAGDPEYYPKLVAELRDRIAALEAEASEGERRGLERAAEVAETWRRVDPASRRTIADHFAVSEDDMLVAVATADGIAEAIRALIPEAPAQPELASSAANQLSGSRVGEPARKGNPEDDPRYPALLADAKARVRNENLDGSPRRHAVAKESE